MSKSNESHVNFTGGELSPYLDARTDTPKYRNSCRKQKNMIPLKQGGATRSPGTQFIAQAKLPGSQYAVRVMKFQFSPTTSFILEFGHHYIRFYSNGQQVTVNSAITWSNTAAYASGTFANDPFDSTIYYAFDTPVVGLAPHADPSNWVAQTILEVPTPYGADTFSPIQTAWETDVFKVVPCQINDVVYLAHPDFPPYKLTRLQDTQWTMEEVLFLQPALLDQNSSTIKLTPSGTSGSINVTASAPAWVAATHYKVGDAVLISGQFFFVCTKDHVAVTAPDPANTSNPNWEPDETFLFLENGTYFQIGQLRAAATLSYDIVAAGTSGTIRCQGPFTIKTYGSWSGDIAVERSINGGASWDTEFNFTSRFDANFDQSDNSLKDALFRFTISNYTAPGVAPAVPPRIVLNAPAAIVKGVVRVTSVSSATVFVASVISDLNSTNATVYWSEGAWSERRGYPQAVTTFQQRVIYGGSRNNPQTIWGTVTDDLENFDLGDQSQDTDAFSFTLNAIGRGPIQWLIAQTNLFAGFAGAEWVIDSGSQASSAITPTAVQAVEHSSWGSAPNVQPAVIGNAVLYTQRQASAVQQMLFSIYTNKYMSNDLSSDSEHLFRSGIVQLDYQPQFKNNSIVWVVTAGGSLCGMTYEQGEKDTINGWHRRVTGDWDGDINDFGFESVAVVQGQGSDDDEIWVVVNRKNGGGQPTRYIERVNPTNWERSGGYANGVAVPNVRFAYYVDCGITTLAISSTISGLGHLEGRYVVGSINGSYSFGPLQVVGGSITIPNYTPALLDVVHVGLPLTYELQPMRLDTDIRIGNTQGLVKAVSDVFVRVFNSLGGNLSNGTTDAPLPFRTSVDSFSTSPRALATGEYRVQPFTKQDNDPTYIVTGEDALPLTVIALVVKYDLTGKP